MAGMEQQKSLDFKKSLQEAEKHSIEDYTPEEIIRNEELLRIAHENKQRVYGDLLRYQVIRDSTPHN